MNTAFPISNFQFPIPATKMSGTGNDFLIIDHRQPFIAPELQSQFAQLVCRNKFSAGADGLILIEDCPEADFQWQFYNADGSSAEMCGNGARCTARYAYTYQIAAAKMSFKTVAGLIEAEMVGDSVKIKLTSPENINMDQNIVLDGTDQSINIVNTGVPHVVCFVDDIKTVPVAEWGSTIRYHDLFQPAGTNVNFAQLFSNHTLSVRTYERGIEAETLACGTGAVAAALISALREEAVSPVEVTTSGGEKLIIHFLLADGKVQEVFLEGPAHFVYEAQLNREAFY
jgi:diaminopimelate epimerase